MRVTLSAEWVREALVAAMRARFQSDKADLVNGWAICSDIEIEVDDPKPDARTEYLTKESDHR